MCFPTTPNRTFEQRSELDLEDKTEQRFDMDIELEANINGFLEQYSLINPLILFGGDSFDGYQIDPRVLRRLFK